MRALLRGALGAAGTVVLARVIAPQAEAAVDQTTGVPLLQRADRLLAATGQAGDGAEEFCRLVNGSFRNGGGGGGGFRNGGFANGGGGGGFRNGGFANGGGGGAGFRNSAFRNY